MDADGTKDGFDLELIRLVRAAVDVPVIASGGAGAASTSRPPSRPVRTRCWPPASSTSATLTVGAVKDALRAGGVPVR